LQRALRLPYRTLRLPYDTKKRITALGRMCHTGKHERERGSTMTGAFGMVETHLRGKRILLVDDERELADMVAGAVLSERDKENITVHIPEDAVGLVEALEKRLEPLRDKMGGVLRIKTESRPPGFVQVETEEGIVDASLDVQLDNLKKQLMALNSRE